MTIKTEKNFISLDCQLKHQLESKFDFKGTTSVNITCSTQKGKVRHRRLIFR